jgi:hypothetical protein
LILFDMKYQVVILQDGETARLDCETLEEAQNVRRSFVNYGKCQEVTIEEIENA